MRGRQVWRAAGDRQAGRPPEHGVDERRLPGMGYPKLRGRLLATLACSSVVAVAAAVAPGFSQSIGAVGSVVVRIGYRAPVSAVVPAGETTLLGLVNRAREAHHLPPLVMSKALRTVARRHSQEMALDGYLGHDSAAGQSFVARLSAAVRGWRAVGENVVLAPTVEEAHRTLMSSPGHLRNILDPVFRRVGIGIATAGAAGYMITEDFAE